MGLLLSFIGMQTSKIVVPDAETMVRTLGGLHAGLCVDCLRKGANVDSCLQKAPAARQVGSL
jgi:hypothetical protein